MASERLSRVHMRKRVAEKTSCRCGYCGAPLKDKWHLDHMKPLKRGRDDIGGDDSEKNLMAACSRCNLWKKTFSVEDFRREITLQAERLYRDSAAYRLAADFQAVEPTLIPVTFYFEKISSAEVE